MPTLLPLAGRLSSIITPLSATFKFASCPLGYASQPSLFQPGSASSLVLAYKDLDSSITQSLLSQCHLYTFRAQYKVKK